MHRFYRSAVAILLIFTYLLSSGGCRQQRSDALDTPAQAHDNNEPMQLADTPEDSIAPQREALTFLYFSDTQPDPAIGDFTEFGELIKRAITNSGGIDLVIFGGDTVNDGGDESEWQKFSLASSALLDGLITAAVAGNHDNYPLLSEQFDYPREAPAGQGGGYFYSLYLAPVYFIMLDSNIMGAANQSDIDWLESELLSDAAQRSAWIIVIMHHPMWPVTDNPKDSQRAETMRENFLPLLEANNAALILCGHQHVYSRTFPMLGNSIADNGQGIVQVMAASGDKATYTMNDSDFVAAGAPASNYLLLEADSESLSITAFDGEGKVVDQYTIER